MLNRSIARKQLGRVIGIFSALSLIQCAGPQENILWEFSPPINPHADFLSEAGTPHDKGPLSSDISVDLKVEAESFDLKLVNNSGDTLRIHWEECLYINQWQRTCRGLFLRRTGNGSSVLFEKPSCPPSTRILPDSAFACRLSPIEYVRHTESRGVDYWIVQNLFGTIAKKDELAIAQGYVGDTVGVVVVVDRAGKREGWHYQFEVVSAELEMK